VVRIFIDHPAGDHGGKTAERVSREVAALARWSMNPIPTARTPGGVLRPALTGGCAPQRISTVRGLTRVFVALKVRAPAAG